MKDMVNWRSGDDRIERFKFEGGERYRTSEFVKGLGMDSRVN